MMHVLILGAALLAATGSNESLATYRCAGMNDLSAMSWSPDHRYLAFGDMRQEVACVLDTVTEQVQTLPPGLVVGWRTKGHRLLLARSGGEPAELVLFDVNRQKVTGTYAAPRGERFGLFGLPTASFSDDGSLVAVSVGLHGLVVLSAATLKQVYTPPSEPGCTSYLAFWKPRSHTMLMPSTCRKHGKYDSDKIDLVDVDAQQNVFSEKSSEISWIGLTMMAQPALWSPDGSSLVTPRAAGDSYMVAIDIRRADGTLKATLPFEHGGANWVVKWSPEGRWAAVDNGQGSRIVDAEAGILLANWDHFMLDPGYYDWTSDEAMVVGGHDLRVAEVTSGVARLIYNRPGLHAYFPALSPGKDIVSVGTSGNVHQLVRLEDGAFVGSASPIAEPPDTTWAADGKHVAYVHQRGDRVVVMTAP